MRKTWHKQSLKSATDPKFKKLMMVLADNVRERRTALCLSQSELAKLANTNYHFICRMETRPTEINPYTRTLWWLSKALECRIGDLLVEPTPTKKLFGLVPGTPQYRLAELAGRMPPQQAKTLVKEAEKLLRAYNKSIQRPISI